MINDILACGHPFNWRSVLGFTEIVKFVLSSYFRCHKILFTLIGQRHWWLGCVVARTSKNLNNQFECNRVPLHRALLSIRSKKYWVIKNRETVETFSLGLPSRPNHHNRKPVTMLWRLCGWWSSAKSFTFLDRSLSFSFSTHSIRQMVESVQWALWIGLETPHHIVTWRGQRTVIRYKMWLGSHVAAVTNIQPPILSGWLAGRHTYPLI